MLDPGSGEVLFGTSAEISAVSAEGHARQLTGDLGTKTVSGDVFRAVFNANRPPIDPLLRGTLFDTSPIP